MIKLHAGNVLLKPAQRKQISSLLRRCVRLGNRLGDFALSIFMRRSGRMYELRAAVHDSAGDFACRTRQNNWQDALRDLARSLTQRLHAQCLQRAAAAAAA
jgi:hypothetical protein